MSWAVCVTEWAKTIVLKWNEMILSQSSFQCNCKVRNAEKENKKELNSLIRTGNSFSTLVISGLSCIF